MAAMHGLGTYLTAGRSMDELVRRIQNAYKGFYNFELTEAEFKSLAAAGFSIPSEFVEYLPTDRSVRLNFAMSAVIDLPPMLVDSDPFGGPSVTPKPAIPEVEYGSLYQQKPPSVKSSPKQEQLVPWQNLPGAVSTFLMDYWVVDASGYGLARRVWEGNTFGVEVGERGLSIRVTLGMMVDNCRYEQSDNFYVGDYPKSGRLWWWMGDKLNALIYRLVDEYRKEAKG